MSANTNVTYLPSTTTVVLTTPVPVSNLRFPTTPSIFLVALKVRDLTRTSLEDVFEVFNSNLPNDLLVSPIETILVIGPGSVEDPPTKLIVWAEYCVVFTSLETNGKFPPIVLFKEIISVGFTIPNLKISLILPDKSINTRTFIVELAGTLYPLAWLNTTVASSWALKVGTLVNLKPFSSEIEIPLTFILLPKVGNNLNLIDLTDPPFPPALKSNSATLTLFAVPGT